MTRNAGPALKRLYNEFGDDVRFVTLYVREAHPGDRYPQPRNFREKLVNARIYRERDRIPWPVAVDDLEGTLHRSLDNKANAAYIVDLDGNVAFRALWSNDYQTLREALMRTLRPARSDRREGKRCIPHGARRRRALRHPSLRGWLREDRCPARGARDVRGSPSRSAIPALPALLEGLLILRRDRGGSRARHDTCS